MRKGITVVPSLIYDHPDDFSRTIKLIDAQVIEARTPISGNFPFDGIETAFHAAADGDHVKLAVNIQE